MAFERDTEFDVSMTVYLYEDMTPEDLEGTVRDMLEKLGSVAGVAHVDAQPNNPEIVSGRPKKVARTNIADTTEAAFDQMQDEDSRNASNSEVADGE